MNEFRLSKYDPKNRIDGLYLVSEWTSIHDIGKQFDAGVLSYDQYKKVEQAYINCCITLFKKTGIKHLYIKSPEYYESRIRFPKSLDSESDIRNVIMYCLQEKCWAKLEAEGFFIHFGYDYYLYIGTELNISLVEQVARQYGLFCEIFLSPYAPHFG